MTNKDLIAQYVDTGLKIPKYQFDKLPSWANKTYIRKRLLASNNGRSYNDDVILDEYELLLLDDEARNKYFKSRINYTVHIKDYEFNLMGYQERLELALSNAKKGNQINDSMFDILPNEEKEDYIKLRISKQLPLSAHILTYLDEDTFESYIDSQIEVLFKNSIARKLSKFNYRIGEDDKYPQWFEVLDDKMRIFTLNKIIDYAIKNNRVKDLKYIDVEDKYYPYLNSNKQYWLNSRIDGGGYISYALFDYLNDDEKIKYVNNHYDKDDYVPKWAEPYLNK